MSPPRQTAAIALTGYTLVLGAVLLSPSSAPGSSAVALVSGLLDDAGAPDALARTGQVEVALNVAVFAPWVALACLVWPTLGWRDWTAYGFVATASVEVAQAVLYSGRSATFSDVVANTLGALLGAGAVSLARRRAARAVD